MKSIKQIIMDQIENSAEILTDIRISRKQGNGVDYGLERNRTTEIIERLHPAKLELVVSEVIELTSEAKTLRLVSKSGYLPPFEAGQYVNIFVELGGVRTSRPYSISSSPRQRAYYEISVARIATGFVSDYLLDSVKPGDEFEANGPAGHFHYNPLFHGKKLCFLAGGSGITPFVSMIRETLNSGIADRQIHLIYGVRTPEQALFRAELEDLARRHSNFSFNLVASDAPACPNVRSGFISAECIKEIVGDEGQYTFYICGPQAMYDFCLAELEKLNVQPKRIRREMFGARADIQNEPGWPAALSGQESFKVKVDGQTITASAVEPLLVALERAGYRVPVSCRSGECSYCRMKLASGKVFVPRGVLMRQADEKYSYIHACKSYPISDLELRL